MRSKLNLYLSRLQPKSEPLDFKSREPSVIYTAWLHYFIGVSVRNIVRIIWESSQFKISPGGLTQAWKKLADLLTPYYDTIEQHVKTSGVLHADETGWRINGAGYWLWCFSNKAYRYYIISKSSAHP